MTHITVLHQIDPRTFRLGGVEGVIRDIARFSPLRTSVEFVGVDSRGDLELGRWTPIEIAGRQSRLLPVARLDPAVHSPIPHTLQLLAGALRYRGSINAAELHVHRSEVGAFAARALRHRRLIQFVHGDIQIASGRLSDTRWRYAPSLLAVSERAAVHDADAVIVFSRSAAARLRERRPDVFFSSAWFDADVFSRSDAPRPPQSLVFVGRLEMPKDPLLFVDVVEQLRDGAWPNVRATMVGDGSIRAAVHRRINRAALSSHVRLVGSASPEAVARQLSVHAVCLVPSHFEGPTPRAVVESLAIGTPVVATPEADPDGLLIDGRNGARAAVRDARTLANLVVDAAAGSDPRQVADTVSDLAAHRVVPRLLASISDAAR